MQHTTLFLHILGFTLLCKKDKHCAIKCVFLDNIPKLIGNEQN